MQGPITRGPGERCGLATQFGNIGYGYLRLARFGDQAGLTKLPRRLAMGAINTMKADTAVSMPE